MHASGAQLAEIVKLVETGVLKTVLDKSYPFSDINEALEYVASGRAKGKVVVTLQ